MASSRLWRKFLWCYECECHKKTITDWVKNIYESFVSILLRILERLVLRCELVWCTDDGGTVKG